MKNSWIITKGFNDELKLDRIYSGDSGSFWSNDAELKRYSLEGFEVSIFIDGYVIPKMDCFEIYKHLQSNDLIYHLFEKYEFEFVKYIKGIFVLVLIINGRYYFYTDHLGIKKCFYFHEKSGKTAITNNLKLLSGLKSLSINPENVAVNILFNHYIDGRTPFNDIFFSGPASRIVLDNKSFNVTNYWFPEMLLNGNAGSLKKIEDIAEFFSRLVNNYVTYFTPDNVSIPITGGLDCRTILAALRANGIFPRTYTYGKKTSADALYGRMIADKLGLEHTQHKPPENLPEWFGTMSDEIVENGNAIVSIHRAHRLQAIKGESEKSDFMFLGYLGGETVRGNWPDNLITSSFALRLWEKPQQAQDLIKEHLKKNYFIGDTSEIVCLETFIKKLKFYSDESTNVNQYYFLLLLKAHIHFAQDLNLFDHYIEKVIPVFMDIDYLKLIFRTPFSLLHRNNLTRSPIKRLNSTSYSCALICNLSDQLSTIPLSKGYSPGEYNKNKYFAVLKREMRKRRERYTPNFDYEDWYKKFILMTMNDNEMIKEIFNVSKALQKIIDDNVVFTNEFSCLPYSRMVEIKKIIETYCLEQL